MLNGKLVISPTVVANDDRRNFALQRTAILAERIARNIRGTMKIKLAYIGGGSKQWARVFMNDLALTEGIEGEIALYDIDLEAARRNAAIGEKINQSENTVTKWKYVVYEKLEKALDGADFVALSILPGTFDEMQSDVHEPEKFGVYQSVGDTVGAGGVLRAMRTVPLYEGFARAIKQCCPNAWVINFTNPMSVCVKTLYDVFPQIKAFGCCHEVFHAQEFLCAVAAEELKVERPKRQQLVTDACGINHFTWITSATFNGHDLLALLPRFIEKHFESGYCERTKDPLNYRNDCFLCGNKVKMDLFRRYGVLGAAGDRHLAEFMNSSWYMADPQTVEKWGFALTSVDFRKKQQAERVAQSIRFASGEEKVKVAKSSEEAVELIKAICGFGRRVSNVNVPNRGQMSDLPSGVIVETNCVFDENSVAPIVATPLPKAVANLVYVNAMNEETCYSGIKNRNFDEIFQSFVNQPSLSSLSIDQAKELFVQMIVNTGKYLDEFFDVEDFVGRL